MSDKKIKEPQANTWTANTPTEFQFQPSNGTIYNETMNPEISQFDLSNGGDVLTLEDAQRALGEHPDLYTFDFEQAAQQYGAIPGMAPIEQQQQQPQQNMNPMQDPAMGFIGSRTELNDILHPTTPGYFGFEATDMDYNPQNNYYAGGNGDVAQHNDYQQDGAASYGFNTAAQTPYDINAIRTPYMAQIPYIQDDEMAGAAGMENSVYATNDIMADANQFFAAAADNATDPFATVPDFKTSERPGSSAAAVKTSKRASRAKGKQPVIPDAEDEDDDDDAFEPAPVSSRRRGKSGGAAVTPAKRAPRKIAGGGGGAKTAVKTPARRKTAAKPVLSERRVRKETSRIGKGKPIPKNLEDCDEADRALVEMRDAGHKWEDITATYTRLCPQHHQHQPPGPSTLPNRYDRLKANFIIMREEDNALLFEAKRDVEAEFQTKKWGLVAEMVRSRGGGRYEAVVLQRQFRKLMLKEGFVVRGVGDEDVDFGDGVGVEGEGEEDEGDAVMGDDDDDVDDLPY